MRILVFLFLCARFTHAFELPSDFKIEIGNLGIELVWSSEKFKVRMGASRPEFRFPDGTVLGYPKEIQGRLHLLLSNANQETLETQGTSLEVWWGGRRLDANAPANVFRTPVGAAAPAATLPTPTVNTDPAQRGNYTTRRASYNLTALDIDEYPVPLEVVAEVTDPPRAPGKRPLIIFLHGRHATCYQGGPNGNDSGDWPCLPGWQPIPSHKGYRYIADILASQGFIIVSISANGINGQDYLSEDLGTSSRSILIRHHLSRWAQWNANGGDPWSNRFRDRLDLNQVVLVGHSRGGEGVHKAAIDASPSDPYKIVGLVTFGPTAFGHQVTPDIHSANILPTCDGDVSDLQGQAYIDTSRDIAYSEALRSAIISVGTNHNFFNTEWTPGLAAAPSLDDWDYFGDPTDPVCASQGGSVRLTAQEQQVVGAAYTAALIHLAVNQDATMLPLLDGTFARPAIIGRAEVATSAVGGAKNRILYRPEVGGQPQFRNGMTGKECLGASPYTEFLVTQASNVLSRCAEGFFYSSPHWLPITSRLSPQALELQWADRPGALVQFRVSNALRNLTTLDSIDVRIANDPEASSGVRFDLVVADANGRNATLRSSLTTIDGWPGSGNLDRIHARTLRGALASVRSQVNLGSIVAIFLVARSASGRVWVLDVAASQSRVVVPAVLNLPVLSVETVQVVETDGPEQYLLNILADRPLTTNASIWVQGNTQAYPLNLVPGGSNVVAQIPIDYVGDNLWSGSSKYSEGYFIEAVQGVLTGDYIGALTIVEDDVMPVISAASFNATAREGRSLQWTVRLSAPTAGITLFFTAVPPSGGAELSSRDVPNSWLASVGVFTPPSKPTPLSSLGIFVQVRFDYGIQSAQLRIPLSSDGQAEGTEMIFLQLANGVDPDQPPPLLTLVGTVLAHS
jgi:hypothetical protein